PHRGHRARPALGARPRHRARGVARRAPRPLQGDRDAMSAPDLLLGIDGGGSKTRAVVADLDGNVLGRGQAAASNYHKVGLSGLWQALTEAIESALRGVAGDAPAPH